MPLLNPADSLNLFVVSVFSGHERHTQNLTPLFRNANPYYWPVIVLFLIFSLYVYIYIVNPKKTLQVFISVYSNQVAKQLYRDDYRLTKRTSVILTACAILSLAFLIYSINNYFGLILQQVYSFKQYLFFMLVLILMYSVKIIGNKLVAGTTFSSELNGEYTYNLFVFLQTLGLVVFPLVICAQYSNYPAGWFLYPAIVLYVLFYVLRLFRGFIISIIEQNVGIVYIFLYFCALEILPILVLIKFLLVNF